MSDRNPGTKLDLEWISKVRVNPQAVLKRAQHIQGQKLPKKQWQAAWLLKAVTCIDLTSLAGDDTPSNIHRLCLKAIQPVRYDLLEKMDMHNKGHLLLLTDHILTMVQSLQLYNILLTVTATVRFY